MKYITDVVIVGAGVIGCSIAYSLRKQGIDVVVLEKDEVGAQASQAASGMLAPLKPFADPSDPYTRLLLSSLARFPDLVPELEDASDMCLAYQSSGTLRVMQTKRLSRLRAWVSTWRNQGFPVQLLIDDEIRQYEPGLATDIPLVLYNPHDPQLNALQLVRAYACAAERLGAMFYTHEEVIAIDHHHEQITGVRTSQGKTIACTYLVLATGAWAAQSDWLRITLPVSPIRGQSIAVRQPTPSLQHMVFGGGIYLAPKNDETIILGVARDEAGFEIQTTPESQAWLYGTAKRLVPALDECPIERAWAGLLPRTPDTRPLLGFAPSWNNVILACGLNGYGLLLSAITGPTIVEQIVTNRIPESLRTFSPERFVVKSGS